MNTIRGAEFSFSPPFFCGLPLYLLVSGLRLFNVVVRLQLAGLNCELLILFFFPPRGSHLVWARSIFYSCVHLFALFFNLNEILFLCSCHRCGRVLVGLSPHTSTKLPGRRASEDARAKKKQKRGVKRFVEKQRLLVLLDDYIAQRGEEEVREDQLPDVLPELEHQEHPVEQERLEEHLDEREEVIDHQIELEKEDVDPSEPERVIEPLIQPEESDSEDVIYVGANEFPDDESDRAVLGN